MALTKKQIKQLRAMANSLKPLFYVGKNDLTESAVNQADETIEKHELIKCAVQDGSGLTAKEAAAELAEQLNAEVVQSIGNRFVLFRRSRRFPQQWSGPRTPVPTTRNRVRRRPRRTD